MGQKKYKPKDVLPLFTAVFGEGIITETAHSKRTDAENPAKTGAWHLYYTGETAHLTSSATNMRTAELANALRRNLYISQWQSSASGTAYTRQQVESLNARIDRCISNQCTINLAELDQLKTLGIKAHYPAQVTHAMKQFLDHEQDWISYRTFLAGKVNQLILGNPNPSSAALTRNEGFHVISLPNSGNFALSLNLAAEPVGLKRYAEFADQGDNKPIYPDHIERFYNKHATRLGIYPFISYNSHHVYNHCPIDEERILIPFRSAEDMAVKIHKLETDPAFLAKVKSFVRRVARDVSAEWVMPACAAEMHEEIETKYPMTEDLYSPGMETARKALQQQRKDAWVELQQKPKAVAWETLRQKTVSNGGMALGDLMQELRNPPANADSITHGVYAEILHAIESSMPLFQQKPRLTGQNVPDPAAPATPAVSATAKPRGMHAGPA